MPSSRLRPKGLRSEDVRNVPDMSILSVPVPSIIVAILAVVVVELDVVVVVKMVIDGKRGRGTGLQSHPYMDVTKSR